MARSTLAAVVMLCIAARAMAVNWTIPTEVPDFATALAHCGEGDTVMVEDGTYSGPSNRGLTLPQLDLLIRSRSGAGSCTINCEDQNHWISVLDSETPHRIVIEGFTITRAQCALHVTYGTVTVRGCDFEGNGTGTSAGGVLYALGPTLTVEDCRFRRNDVGVSGQGGVAWLGPGRTTLVRCLFEHNHAGYGGAIYGGVTGTLSMENCTVSGNVAEYEAGGIDYGSGELILMRTIVYGNHSVPGHADEIFALNQTHEPECCDLRREGIVGPAWAFGTCIDADPVYCDAADWEHPEYPSDYRLRSDSPCLPGGNPCGEIIGALAEGCFAEGSGACCLTTGDCVVVTESACSAINGDYQGDGSTCDPNPCHPTPTKATTWGRIKSSYR